MPGLTMSAAHERRRLPPLRRRSINAAASPFLRYDLPRICVTLDGLSGRAIVTAEDGDDELIGRAARGDGAAFSRLVGRYRIRLIAMATRIVGNRAIAEEVVQEVFTRAWINAPRWQPQRSGHASFGAWLGRVATNLSIDHIRRAPLVSLDNIAEPADTALGADARLIAEEDQRRLAHALAELPPRQRAAIALTYDQGLSNAEGAQALDISVGAFELLLVRARRKLRQVMRDVS